MVPNMTDTTPLLIRGIKRCSRLGSRQYFPFPLKLYSEHFFFHETNINTGGFCILDDALVASKHFNTFFSCHSAAIQADCSEKATKEL